jgi:DNA-binding transcriptional LysR family regulator
MRLPVVPAGPWSTAVQPSYQVLPMEDTRQVLGALSRPAVSVVQLRRGGTRGRQRWPQGSETAPARADTRLSLSAGAAAASEASDDAELVALLDAYPLQEQEINLLYPSHRHPSSVVRAYLEFCQEYWKDPVRADLYR